MADGSGEEVHHPTILGLGLGLGLGLRIWLGLGLGSVSWVVNFTSAVAADLGPGRTSGDGPQAPPQRASHSQHKITKK